MQIIPIFNFVYRHPQKPQFEEQIFSIKRLQKKKIFGCAAIFQLRLKLNVHDIIVYEMWVSNKKNPIIDRRKSLSQ